MSNKAYNESSIQAIANAIRDKNGSSDTYTVAQMAAAINNISTGVNGADFLVPTGVDPSTGLGELDLSDARNSEGRPVINIRAYAFNQCNYNKVLLPRTAQSLGNNCFLASKALEEVVLYDSVTSIGENAFSGCDSVDIDHLPNNMTFIGANAFKGCFNLTLDNLPTGARLTLGANAFQGTGITITEVPANIDIANYAQIFRSCDSIHTIKIKVAAMYRTTFMGCTNLTKAWISNNCQTISCAGQASWSPFSGCTSLTDIYCEASEAPAGWGPAFANTSSSTQATVHWGVSESDFDQIIGGE